MDTVNGLGKDAVGKMFSQALYNVVTTMTGLSLEEVKRIKEDVNHNIAGVMMFAGDTNMFLIISSNEISARILISYMTGIEQADLKGEDLQDGITEFANMVAGSSKEALSESGYEYNLTIPFTITGDHIRFLTKNKIQKYQEFYQNSEIEIMMQVFCC